MKKGIAFAALVALVVLALIGTVCASLDDVLAPRDGVSSDPRASGNGAALRGEPAVAAGDVKHPDAAPAARTRKCALIVRLRTPDGSTTEGIGVEVNGVWGCTGSAGAVRFEELRSGRSYDVVVRSPAGPELARSEVAIPRDATQHIAEIDVPRPMAVELLLRLRGAPDRREQADVRLALPGMSTEVALPPGQDVWRFSMVLGGRADLSLQVPGYRPVARTVEAPRVTGVHTVDVDLIASGLDTHGRVVDADGAPVEGASVLVYENRDPGRRLHHAVTGADGRFEIVPRYIEHPWVVRHRWRRLCSDWFVPAQASESLEVVLHAGARVEGTLRDGAGNGAPLVYAPAVRFGGGPELRTWTSTEVVQADIDGNYVIGGIPEGWWVRPFVDRRQGGRPRPGSEDLDFRALDFEADRAAGRVHRAGGAGDVFRRDLEVEESPVVSCSVRLQFPDGVAYTGSARIEFSTAGADLRRGGVGVIVSHVTPDDPVVSFGTSRDSNQMLRVRAGAWSGKLGPVDLQSGRVEPFVVRLAATRRVVVQLVSPAGADITQRDVWVGVANPEHHERMTKTFRIATNGSGRADISSLVPDEGDWPDEGIGIVVDGVVRLHLSAPPAAGEDGVVVLRVPAPAPSTITIRTVDEAGEPVADVPWSASTEWVLSAERGRTNDRGTCAVELLRARNWRRFRLRAGSPFTGELAFDDESLREADTWTLVVSRLPHYDVLVRDELGRPVPGVNVAGESTDAAGRARVHGKPGTDIGGWSPTHAIVDQALPASNAEPVEFVARMLRSLRVVVRPGAELPAGTPLELVVDCVGDPRIDGQVRRFETSADGQPVEITTSVVAEPYRLTIRHAKSVWTGTVHVSGDATATEIAVGRAPTRPVRLRLEDTDGSPLRGREVSIRVHDVPWLDDVRRTTDADGTFAIEVPDFERTFLLGFRLGTGDFRYVSVPPPPDAKQPVPLRLSTSDR